MTFADDIEAAANGEAIDAVVLSGSPRYEPYGPIDARRKAPVKVGVRLSWQEARPMLDYEYNDDFGTQDCDSIYAWTASRVMYVQEYDGSTTVMWLPRNPVDVVPES